MSERSNRGRLARAHPVDEQFGLAVEQLQYFSFKAAIAESHAGQMGAVEHRALEHRFRRAFNDPDRGLRHAGLPYLFLGAQFDLIGTKSR
jgi:hypothetical protein